MTQCATYCKTDRRHSRSVHPQRHRSHYRRRLRFETLEDRRVLAALTVTTPLDIVDFNDGLLSLREAVFVANTVPGHDTINFDFGHDGPETIVLTQGELRVTDSLTITGPGAQLLAIDARGNDPTPEMKNGDGSRVFNIDDGTAIQINVAISGLTLTGGDSFDSGGAIFARETVSLTDVTIIGNAVYNGTASGGGIAALATLSIENSRIVGNMALGNLSNGGGIYSIGGELAISNSTIAENQATTGGGIARRFAMSLTNSEVLSNLARGPGGGLHITNGNVQVLDSLFHGNRTTDSFSNGAGIYLGPASNHVIRRTVISDNSTAGTQAHGGGLFMASARGVSNLLLEDVTVSNNEVNGATSDGGGLAFNGAVTMLRSTFADNFATNHGGGVVASGALFSAEQSTFSGNLAGGNGGGIYASLREFRAINATISGNRANDDGGGVFLALFNEAAASAALRHSTLTANRANADSAGGGAGGGVFMAQGALVLDHAIIAGNFTNTSNIGPDLTGLIGASFSPRYSLIGNSAHSGLSPSPPGMPDGNGNRIGGANASVVNPVLGPLADYGGPTRTHVLLSNSPALNAGDPAAIAGANGVPFNDQRGAPFTRVYGGRIDIGAFEQQPIQFILGDFNRDGTVDSADYIVWRKQVGKNLQPGTGADANADGIVDYTDRAIWMSNLSMSNAPQLMASVLPVAQGESVSAPSIDVQQIHSESADAAIATWDAPPIWKFTREATLLGARHAKIPLALRVEETLLAWLVLQPGKYELNSSLGEAASNKDGASSKLGINSALDRFLEMFTARF